MTTMMQLCQNYTTSRATYPALVQEKKDGIRVQLRFDCAGHGHWVTRHGNVLGWLRPLYIPIKQALRKIRQVYPLVIDGELCHQSGCWSATMSAFRAEDPTEMVFWVFDFIEDSRELQSKRLEKLNRFFAQLGVVDNVKKLEGVVAEDESAMLAFYEQALGRGEEGVVVKDLDGCYKSQRTVRWLKLKPSQTVSGQVVSSGQVILDKSDGGKVVTVSGLPVEVGGRVELKWTPGGACNPFIFLRVIL